MFSNWIPFCSYFLIGFFIPDWILSDHNYIICLVRYLPLRGTLLAFYVPLILRNFTRERIGSGDGAPALTWNLVNFRKCVLRGIPK